MVLVIRIKSTLVVIPSSTELAGELGATLGRTIGDATEAKISK